MSFRTFGQKLLPDNKSIDPFCCHDLQVVDNENASPLDLGFSPQNPEVPLTRGIQGVLNP
jgi:hypothetical protein